MSANRIAQSLTWLGGGEWRELGERHERSTHVIAGVVVLLGAALAWLFSTLAITETMHAISTRRRKYELRLTVMGPRRLANAAADR